MVPAILVTLDGSSFSRSVLNALPRLFGDGAASLYLLTVAPLPAVEPSGPRRADFRPSAGVIDAPGVSPAAWFEPSAPSLPETGDQAIDRVINENREILEDDARALRDRGFAVECGVVVNDDPVAAIIEVASARNVDLIAMATHGRGGLSRIIQGSVAGRVVESGVRPVLLVRPSSA